MSEINIIIDDIKVTVHQGKTVLEAAQSIGIKIPTLCYLKDVNNCSSCRVCVVDVNNKLLASCSLKAENGMVVKTNTKEVRESRRLVIELLLSNHNRECTLCGRSEKCELQNYAKELNIREIEYTGKKCTLPKDISSSLVRDPEKCILCGRCISTCSRIQSVNAIGYNHRGFFTEVSTAYDQPMKDSVCINCGQCIMNCPVGALLENNEVDKVWKAIDDKSKYVVVQTAPAIRVALGEEFDMPYSSNVTGKMVTALKKIGFKKVFDTDFAADLTILEEGTELIKRLEKNKSLPLMTSCCPGWVKFVEHFYPHRLENLSTCKSPHEMEGALIKSYFANKEGIDPKDIVVVSIMPCVAKKFESSRDELGNEILQDVDIVLTTRELALLIKERGLDFAKLEDSDFDEPFSKSSGAAVIFGATGGVLEAALRTVADVTGNEDYKDIDYEVARGPEGIKITNVTLGNGTVLKAAIVNGLANARKLMNMLDNNEIKLDVIEVMACPGGCVNGGGQPLYNKKEISDIEMINLRSKAIYEDDKANSIRKSHKNDQLIKLYEEFLKEPNGELAHKLLHTHYKPRKRI